MKFTTITTTSVALLVAALTPTLASPVVPISAALLPRVDLSGSTCVRRFSKFIFDRYHIEGVDDWIGMNGEHIYHMLTTCGVVTGFEYRQDIQQIHFNLPCMVADCVGRAIRRAGGGVTHNCPK